MSAFDWNAHPAVRCALAFAAGICCANLVGVRAALLAMSVAAAAFAFFRARGNTLSGVPMILLVWASGLTLTHIERVASGASVPNVSIERVDCVATVCDAPVVRGAQISFTIACDSILFRNDVAHVRGRVLVRVFDSKSSVNASLQPGDRISARGTLRSPTGAAVPGGFDERMFLSSDGVSLVLNVADAREIHRISSAGTSSITTFIRFARNQMSEFAQRYVGGPEGEVVEALLNGDRTGIDRETRDAFVATGTLHVLAVSGLHVAVFALGLAVLTSWIPSRWIQLLIFVAALGAYAMIAGAGASIVRAWFMATCFMLAKVVGRRARSLNVLAASALVLVILHPTQLFDIGFQLSFAAVTGIIMFQTRWITAIDVHCHVIHNNAALTWATRSLVLTISAQLLTAPLLLVHFGGVPVTGLLLNLVVVPLTSCAMAAAAIGTIVSPFALVPDWMGATAFASTRLAVQLVEWGATLPLASVGTARVPWMVGAAVITTILWSSRARTIVASMIRLSAALVIAIAGVALNSRLDPLATVGAPRAYIVPLGRGSVVAVHCGDSVAIVARDSVTAARSSASIGSLLRHLGARRCRDILLSPPIETGPNAFETSTGRRYWQSDRVPVIVTDRTIHPVRVAGGEGLSVLIAGLNHHHDRMLAFEYRGTWTRIPWD